MAFKEAMQQAGRAIAQGTMDAAQYSAKAAATANSVSAGAQAAQGAFNQNSVNLANTLGSDRLAQQWAWNSAGAQLANDFTREMWNQSAEWNAEMFDKQMEFAHNEAQLNREWQEHMRDTAYQAARKDLELAGLNPILAVTGGGIQTGSGSGATASVGLPSMGGASGAMPSAGLLQGQAASEGNYSGQMEYMGGILGLISAGMNGLASALTVMGENRSVADIIGGVIDEFSNPSNKNSAYGNIWRFFHRNDWEEKDDGYLLNEGNYKRDNNYTHILRPKN